MTSPPSLEFYEAQLAAVTRELDELERRRWELAEERRRLRGLLRELQAKRVMLLASGSEVSR